MRVLPLLGSGEDNGGILTTVRSLVGATRSAGWEHQVWVNHAYR